MGEDSPRWRLYNVALKIYGIALQCNLLSQTIEYIAQADDIVKHY